ncbi:hypothetical protein BDY21DRAFT_398725, partial [Lineolata rhizophorae]
LPLPLPTYFYLTRPPLFQRIKPKKKKKKKDKEPNMGWFTPSRPSYHRTSSVYSGHSGRSSSHGGGPGSNYYFVRPSSSASHRHHSSSYYGGGGTSDRGYYTRSSSYYKRRPRDGYLAHLLHKLRRLLRDLVRYARRHPFKMAAALAAVPLLGGGLLYEITKAFGVKLSLPGLMGAAMGAGGGRSRGGLGAGGEYYGSRGYGDSSSGLFGLGSGGGGLASAAKVVGSVAGGAGGLASLLKIVQTFS